MTALPPLRPYQAEAARAILRQVATRGGSISIEIARQGGKNETSAQVELALLLLHHQRGGTLLKCAPTLEPQARISYRRLRARVAAAGLEGLLRPAGAAGLRLGRAEARFLSAEPSANVVGHTADLLLEVDEAQDVDAEKFDREFRPMAAAANAPTVFYGTPWGPRSLLEQAKAHHRSLERRDGQQRHFRVPWERVAEAVPAYRDYVEAERDRLGERHPLFRTQYLLEVLEDAGRLLDAATLARLEGDHPRQHTAHAGERIVAGLDLGGAARAEAEAKRHDWTVLTVARVAERPGRPPLIEVVEHRAWQGVPTEPLIEELTDLLRRWWRVRRVAVDASGLGGPIAELLAARLPRGVLEPVVLGAERKSRLGFALLAAAHSGRLRLYAIDGSREAAECRRQLALARVTYHGERLMRFGVDPTEGHDDYLVSLALAVAAAGGAGAERMARGSLGGPAQEWMPA